MASIFRVLLWSRLILPLGSYSVPAMRDVGDVSLLGMACRCVRQDVIAVFVCAGRVSQGIRACFRSCVPVSLPGPVWVRLTLAFVCARGYFGRRDGVSSNRVRCLVLVSLWACGTMIDSGLGMMCSHF